MILRLWLRILPTDATKSRQMPGKPPIFSWIIKLAFDLYN